MTLANETPTVAIIGYGTAGVNALIGLRNAGYEGPVRVFSNTSTLPYSPILTSYYAGGQKTYQQCFPWSEDELAELDACVLQDCPVSQLDVEGRLVHTPLGAFPYTKCIIATGATPMTWGFPQDCGYEPMVLRTMADAERLKAALERPACKKVLVSGASMVALKMLEAALEQGKQATLVGMNPHVLDMTAFPPAAQRFEEGLRNLGVNLRLGTVISQVEVLDGEDTAEGRLRVTFKDGSVECFDEIAVAHGMKCNLDFVPEGALEMDRAVLVDEFMRTSNPHVYAAGDIAQATELISGEKRIVGIWKNAALQGATAGTAAAAALAGEEPPASAAFRGSIAANTIAVKGTLFISAGATDVCEGRYLQVKEEPNMTVVYLFEGEEGATSPAAATGAESRAVSSAAIQPEAPAGTAAPRLVGFNLVCTADEAGSVAYDTGAMLTLRIQKGLAR